jgi:hypothetical protein
LTSVLASDPQIFSGDYFRNSVVKITALHKRKGPGVGALSSVKRSTRISSRSFERDGSRPFRSVDGFS